MGKPHSSSKPRTIQIARTLWQIGKLVNWPPDNQFTNLLILLPLRKTVTDPPLGEDVLGLVGIFLYLLSIYLQAVQHDVYQQEVKLLSPGYLNSLVTAGYSLNYLALRAQAS